MSQSGLLWLLAVSDVGGFGPGPGGPRPFGEVRASALPLILFKMESIPWTFGTGIEATRKDISFTCRFGLAFSIPSSSKVILKKLILPSYAGTPVGGGGGGWYATDYEPYTYTGNFEIPLTGAYVKIGTSYANREYHSSSGSVSSTQERDDVKVRATSTSFAWMTAPSSRQPTAIILEIDDIHEISSKLIWFNN